MQSLRAANKDGVSGFFITVPSERFCTDVAGCPRDQRPQELAELLKLHKVCN